MKAIIPCAGFGTRMQMLPDQSKEMLTDLVQDRKIIDYSLGLAKAFDIKPVIISRKEKKDLNEYVLHRGAELFLIEKSTEWYDSILQSYSTWDLTNIVILPDTRWENDFESIRHMKLTLDDLAKQLSLGVLDIEDPTKWCVLDKTFSYAIEKPTQLHNVSNLAIGLFGFNKIAGKLFFESIKANKRSLFLPENTQFFELDCFRDITREKSDNLKYV